MTRQEIQGEITACKQLLADSDYSILKSLEGLLTCTTATGMIAHLKELAEEVFALKLKRQAWRDKINEMEALLEATTDDETDSPADELEGGYTEDEVEPETTEQTVEPDADPATEVEAEPESAE